MSPSGSVATRPLTDSSRPNDGTVTPVRPITMATAGGTTTSGEKPPRTRIRVPLETLGRRHCGDSPVDGMLFRTLVMVHPNSPREARDLPLATLTRGPVRSAYPED